MPVNGRGTVATHEAPGNATAARFPSRPAMCGDARTATRKAFPEASCREIIAHLGG